ncbi:MAG: GH36 C-terminal domain-containing protein, partial [Hyphomonas sp.]|nr:GH36 C-terminal domain-containing protein [Hyphomonas sp.]
RPNTLWENFDDGGNMMTYNMARRYVTSVNADNTSALSTRKAVYGATFPFSSQHTDRYMEDSVMDAYITRTSMYGGGPWIFMNRIDEMTAKDIAFARKEVDLFKSIRRRLRDGRFFHLMPPGENRYDALQSADPSTGASIVFVMKEPGAPASGITLRLKGLDPETAYTVTFQDRPAVLNMTGAQLMGPGLRLNIQEPRGGELVYVNSPR